jgi:hypothetical protein
VPWLSARGLFGKQRVPRRSSITKNGGFAEYLLADPNYVVQVPAGLAAVDAAPLICAGVTTWKWIKETQAKLGEWIAVSGVGGLGQTSRRAPRPIWRNSSVPWALFFRLTNEDEAVCISLTIRNSLWGAPCLLRI